MNAGIFSLYWDNIDERVVRAQRVVCERFGIPIQQHRINGMDHGEWIDWVMGRWKAVDVFMFMDIDCIPLERVTFAHLLNSAHAGWLCGAEGAANHINPKRSYAGAWFVAINHSHWQIADKPTARAAREWDVCQNWTNTWNKKGWTVFTIPPTACEHPKWNLPGRLKAYGIGTTYGDYCYHLFESRGQNPQPFLNKCAQVLNAAH